jgi:hypothetical protein
LNLHSIPPFEVGETKEWSVTNQFVIDVLRNQACISYFLTLAGWAVHCLQFLLVSLDLDLPFISGLPNELGIRMVKCKNRSFLVLSGVQSAD